MTRAIFAGLSTIDIVYRIDSFPAANTKIAASSQDLYIGGPATNAAIAFAHLGGAASLVTAVGSHPLAAVIREELLKFSIQLVDLNPAFDGAPALSSVSVDRDGHRNVVSANAVRVAVPPAKVDRKLLQEARILLVDGHFMQAAQAWATAAHERGIPVVLDGGSWKAGTDELLQSVDTAICSADFRPPGCSTAEDTIQFLRNRGLQKIAITHGADPIRSLEGDSSGTIPVPRVPTVDTMGAGDILHGAYCFFTASGRGFAAALGEAAKIASESCRWAGTREWMKHQPAIDTRRIP